MQLRFLGLKQIIVRSGKGNKDRVAPIATKITADLQQAIEHAKNWMLSVSQKDTERFICSTLWHGNTQMRPRSLPGSMFFRRGNGLLTPVLALSGDTISVSNPYSGR